MQITQNLIYNLPDYVLCFIIQKQNAKNNKNREIAYSLKETQIESFTIQSSKRLTSIESSMISYRDK